MMSAAVAFVALTGLGLALLFKVPALVAASFLLAAVAAVIWSLEEWSLLEGALKVGGLIGLLQVSYVAGLGLAHLCRQLRRRWAAERGRKAT